MTRPAISIDNVSKKFVIRADRASSIKEAFLRRGGAQSKDFWALRGISFDIPRGSFYGIIGHNGSGKSTLLRLTAGIHRPTTGSITADGQVSALLELGSGFHPDLTGRENIFLNGAMLGLPRSRMAAAIDEITEFSGIGDFVDAPVKVYSSGMHVRLGFAIAVHVEPEILLVDEVLAVGDEEFQRKCFDHIYKLRRRGTTIVLVSHDAATMQQLCDEVAWLDHGELQEIGPPTPIVESYLARVNEQENERRGLQPTVIDPLEMHAGARRGTGEIRVTNISILGPDESERATATSGDPLHLRVHFDTDRLIERPVFGVAFYSESGAYIAGPNSKLAQLSQNDVGPGAGYFDFHLDRLPLLPGQYYLSTGVDTPDLLHCYDWWERSTELIVQPGSAHQRHGMIDLDARFEPAVTTNPATTMRTAEGADRP
jgi:ABC-2 type transport system ATP-binding protein/lipopolysaccharide transport system ATP-binding protein